MCSIIGYLGSSISAQALRTGFDKTISRGPDDTRMLHIGAATLGFHRLAIMGLHPEGMQPFTRDGSALVCNGEIYGFRPIRERLIAEGETFESESDCEILLPLYEREGLDMFRGLDAEFAMIIYDAKRGGLVAARDPIGIRPLYYGYDAEGAIIFASEAKNLVGFVHDVMPFPPGHYYADGKFTCYRDMTHVDAVCEDDLETVCTNIREKLIAGVQKRLDADAPLGFLLSGGLDSSLVCAISAKLLKKPIRTFAIGMRSDAIDLKYAREVAEYLHADHTEIIITREDVLQALPEVVALLGTYDITTIRASIGMYLVCKAIHEQTDLRVLLTGEISDELFGYKYTDFAPSPAAFQEESASASVSCICMTCCAPTAASPSTVLRRACRLAIWTSCNMSCPSTRPRSATSTARASTCCAMPLRATGCRMTSLCARRRPSVMRSATRWSMTSRLTPRRHIRTSPSTSCAGSMISRSRSPRSRCSIVSSSSGTILIRHAWCPASGCRTRHGPAAM